MTENGPIILIMNRTRWLEWRLHLFYEIGVHVSIEYRLDSVGNTLFTSQFINGVRPELCYEIDHRVGTVDYPRV